MFDTTTINTNYMSNSIAKEKLFVLRYANAITESEISQFRGALNKLLEDEPSLLFHNHTDEGFRYAYPLIQYKRINGKAALVCINKGTEAVALLLGKANVQCDLQTRSFALELDGVKAHQHLIQTWDSTFVYYLRRWLPLNQENFASYQKIEGMVEKCQFLERILSGNILSMGKGLGIHFEHAITTKILNIDRTRIIPYKNVKMMAFDIVFKSNVSLPDYIGLGKGASTGFGVLARKRENKEEIK